MGKPETRITDLCNELGISSQTLYRYVSPTLPASSEATTSPTEEATSTAQ